jgi:light-harvesting complex 1 beta chain
MSASLPPREGSLSGLTETEAKEFHKISIVAHFLVWSWRPWIPGPGGYTTSMLTEHAHYALALAANAFA